MRIDLHERQEALAAGITRMWPVFTRYEIVDDTLRPAGEVERWYAPVAHRNIATDLAKLVDAPNKTIIAFAQRWGALGHRSLEPTTQTLLPSVGDPVPWIRAHARGVQVALTLGEYLSHPDSAALGRYLRELGSVYPNVFVPGQDMQRFRLEVGAGDAHGDEELVDYDGDPRRTAGILLEWILNPNLALLRQEVAVTNGDVTAVTRYPSLAVLVYWHLQHILTGGYRGARCAECGHFFEQTNRHQRFCPPPPGTTESRCANRFRQNAHRRKVSEPDADRPV